MSRRPSDQEIDETISELYRLLRDYERGHDLRKRLKHANKLDRRGGTNRVHDGYPRGTSGRGPTNQVGRPTESSALGDYRTVKGAPPDPAEPDAPGGAGHFITPSDPVREFFERAWANVEKAAVALRVADQQLSSIDALGLGAPEPEPCDACFAFDRSAPMQVFSDAAGRLPQKMRLCSWHYDRIRKTGKMPTEQQVHGHHDGRVHVDPTANKAAS